MSEPTADNALLIEWPWLTNLLPFLPSQLTLNIIIAVIFAAAGIHTIYKSYCAHRIFDKVVKDLDNL